LISIPTFVGTKDFSVNLTSDKYIFGLRGGKDWERVKCKYSLETLNMSDFRVYMVPQRDIVLWGIREKVSKTSTKDVRREFYYRKESPTL